MADVIQLLPDAIANQIAAGEVVQRPASVVKELMENAIDAGSSSVKLIVKDGGKQLIQVIDNGCGMSEVDARMAFERHATSKIRKAEDLFAIRTMGFRGEALASIAAVAQVELKTRRQADELGVKLEIEGSELKNQELCQCAAGTSFSVKNLFYNIPARRNFLKSTSAEMRHILDEFQRLAIAHPDVFFSLHHNNNEVFHLPAANLRQRLVGLLGNAYNKRLVPITEQTDVLEISGYIGKPEFAKKSRGEQYFFVNDRFIKSGYLNHAVMSAYEGLLPTDTFPLYVIFMQIDPARIDVNVHPTKQEIKFEDERLVYNYLKVAVRHALGQHSVMPTLDFDQETSFSPHLRPQSSERSPRVDNYPSDSNRISAGPAASGKRPDREAQQEWETLYSGLENFTAPDPTPDASGAITLESSLSQETTSGSSAERSFQVVQRQPYQIHQRYIVSHIKSGFMLIDQQAAHERILYEHYLDVLSESSNASQTQLFPRTLQLTPGEATLLTDLLPQINQLGFDVQPFGTNTFVINGVPAELANKRDEAELIEQLLGRYKSNLDLDVGIRENLARSMARSAAMGRGEVLSPLEMQALIDQLFACELPYKSPSGRACFITFDLDELSKRFEG